MHAVIQRSLAYDKYPSCIQVRATFPFDLLLSDYNLPLSVPLFYSSLSRRPPAGWMVRSSARCASWRPRRSLTWGEHRRRVKLTFYFITHVEAPAVLNVNQRVNAAHPEGNNKNINRTITSQEEQTRLHIYISTTGSKAGCSILIFLGILDYNSYL